MGLTYDDARSVLHDAIQEGADASDGRLRLFEAFSAIAQPGHVVELMTSISGNAGAVEAGAARSFRHPLGFTKVTLIDALPLFTLRIHAWWPAAQPAADHIHNHRYWFVSRILIGSYDMELFQKADDGELMVEYQEEVSRRQGWQLARLGRSHLQRLGTFRLGPNSRYDLPPETLHRISVPPDSACVTILLQSASTRSTTQVFLRPSQPRPEPRPKNSLSIDAYKGQFEALLAVLAS
jgi:hypothetical protein